MCREFEIALPSELPQAQRKALALKFARELSEKHGCGVDFAVHAPGKEGDTRNEHAHVLTTTRRLTPEGFGEKCRELDDQKSGEVLYWRARWSMMINEELQAAALEVRVDHRSLEDQKIDRAPTVHLGPVRTAINRRLLRRPHAVKEPTELTASQLRGAKQLATMRARLNKSNFSKFESSPSQPLSTKGKLNDDTPTSSR